ncbi:MAG: alpha-1,2-fucosyltransferase [Paracoccaceae bacterium]
MIFSRLHGRLGNQMFQYAIGRALALDHKAPLLLDGRIIENADAQLFRFDIQAEIAGGNILPPDKSQPIPYISWRYFGGKPQFCRERGLGYMAASEEFSDNIYLHGYWQSEKYFTRHAPQIRKDFTLKVNPSGQNAEMLDRIRGCNAVSIHVRRGDYITDTSYQTCDLDYYKTALQHVVDATGKEPVVFIFSDDPNWVSDNLSVPFERVVVDINDGDHGYEDMRLMACCQNNIIANSSFSWWGAWLNTAPDKVVVAPEKWFVNPKMHNPDITPENWVRL